MANFLADYIDETTGLPRPSYDLWEEVFLTTTYTTSVTYGALLAAADLADVAGDADSGVKWRSAAEDIRQAAAKHLFNEEREVFYKGIIVKDGVIVKNETLDTSAVFGAFMFGLFDAKGAHMLSAIKTTKEIFNVSKENPGLPRYENDNYRRSDPSVTGNWWYITSLWLAQYMLDEGDTDGAMNILDWVKSKAMSTGMLGEQVDPTNQALVSPAPLTWSHAEYLSTLLDLSERTK